MRQFASPSSLTFQLVPRQRMNLPPNPQNKSLKLRREMETNQNLMSKPFQLIRAVMKSAISSQHSLLFVPDPFSRLDLDNHNLHSSPHHLDPVVEVFSGIRHSLSTIQCDQ